MNSGRFKKGQTPHNKGKYSTGNRKSRRHDNWSKKVRERDGWKCTMCGSEKNLHAHHIIPWKESEELRFDIKNGKTLCGSCHCSIEPRCPKGIKAWNKGLKLGRFSPETEIKKGEHLSPKTEFKKGQVPWNKGKKMSKEYREKLSLAHKGQRVSPKTEFKKGMTPWNKGLKKETV